MKLIKFLCRQRSRNLPPVPPEVAELRILLNKEYCYYKLLQYRQDMLTMDNILYSQQKALEELRKESEELYNEAIQVKIMILYKVKDCSITNLFLI